jgi:mRNA-degrading endonuclease RelE of RelBE toxin-antitoxin system
VPARFERREAEPTTPTVVIRATAKETISPSRNLLGIGPPLAYACVMIFIETSVFTSEIKRLLPDEEYRRLQTALMLRPDMGSVIQGSGGLRKVRWNLPAEGKRGGLRIIYCWQPPDTIFMLLPYRKSAQDDLTPRQLTVLKALMKEWFS